MHEPLFNPARGHRTDDLRTVLRALRVADKVINGLTPDDPDYSVAETEPRLPLIIKEAKAALAGRR